MTANQVVHWCTHVCTYKLPIIIKVIYYSVEEILAAVGIHRNIQTRSLQTFPCVGNILGVHNNPSIHKGFSCAASPLCAVVLVRE